uniref:Secreted protein n=1 Tax=Steinernema glaseri TaxID=37863 RepID=A0A1I7YP88_9BILA
MLSTNVVLATLVAIVLVAVGTCQEPDEEFDPLAAHGGIFRNLDWTPAELARISQYHALAEYHQLIEFVKDKVRNSDVDFVTRQRIGKFLKMKRPPSVLRTLLTKKEKHK